jgi:hypothetical protein
MQKKVTAIFLQINRWSSFSPKIARKSIKKRFLARASRIEQQKQNRSASD